MDGCMTGRAVHAMLSGKGRIGLGICCGEQLIDEDHTGQEMACVGNSGFRAFHRNFRVRVRVGEADLWGSS